MKKVNVIFSDEAMVVYEKICRSSNKEDKILKNAIDNKIELIIHDIHYGNPMRKSLIPKRYDTRNLFRIELPCFWRMMYALKGNNLEIVAIIVDILNHKEYNKSFGYK